MLKSCPFSYHQSTTKPLLFLIHHSVNISYNLQSNPKKKKKKNLLCGTSMKKPCKCSKFHSFSSFSYQPTCINYTKTTIFFILRDCATATKTVIKQIQSIIQPPKLSKVPIILSVLENTLQVTHQPQLILPYHTHR